MTGTDTDVGKSAVTASLSQFAATLGSACAAKPVASGVTPGCASADACLIAEAAGHEPRELVLHVEPVSPHRAALDTGRFVQPDTLASWIRDLRGDTVFVEGVGGWRVPIQVEPRIDVVDLARWTEGQVLVVALDRLGVLNHAALTVEAIRADGLELAGLVLNQIPGHRGPSSNLADLQLLLDCPVVLAPPFDPTDAAERLAVGQALWQSLWGHTESSGARAMFAAGGTP